MTISPLLEACVETLDEAITAERRGAHRLELCTNLHEDGTTPDIALISAVLEHVQIPVKVMIRPRGGGFEYTEEEFKEMLASIETCKSLGVPEIVTGVLLPDHTLDLVRIKALVDAANPMHVTIHKCIDLVPDVFHAIEQLKQIPGVRSILSSGQAPSALSGAGLLQKMVDACEGTITLIVAGKVTQGNLETLLRKTEATAFHGRNIV